MIVLLKEKWRERSLAKQLLKDKELIKNYRSALTFNRATEDMRVRFIELEVLPNSIRFSEIDRDLAISRKNLNTIFAKMHVSTQNIIMLEKLHSD